MFILQLHLSQKLKFKYYRKKTILEKLSMGEKCEIWHCSPLKHSDGEVSVTWIPCLQSEWRGL